MSNSKIAIFLVTFFSIISLEVFSKELPDFSELAEVSSPAVVYIRSKRTVTSSSARNRGFNDPFFDDFFRRYFPDEQQRGGRERQTQSSGSGFIISEDGYLLTNNHVVEGADEITISLKDRREFKAEIIGSDKRSDVALLKINGNDLPIVQVGNSKELEVGEWVVAIGSPFQLNSTVTAGIVSAKGRSIPNGTDSNYVPFIQTDVAINPGNSGGPLFNLEGEVVGINSSIYTRTGAYMGVSFSIPIDYAMDIVNQLKESGFVARGWLGVSIQEVNSDFAKDLGMSVPKGALISQVMEGSPAEKSGLQVRDVIVEFDGVDIIYSGDLPHTVGSIRPGTEVEAEVIRDKKNKKLKIKVGELPTNNMISENSSEDKGDILGLTVKAITGEKKRELGISYGVEVVQVEPSGLAASQGIMTGDLITQVGNKKVRSSRDFLNEIEKLKETSGTAMILLVRNGQPIFITLKLVK
ncbi:MAG: Do family serine endopeptidase [Pseudomonadota bacterium]|nr:Do family serine endopeptidase [Pseudomonadota bacterium]